MLINNIRNVEQVFFIIRTPPIMLKEQILY